jgi:hypothetical protein
LRQAIHYIDSSWVGILLSICAAAPFARAEIIDRIAVSVGNSVITTSDIEREIRVTAFLNREQPDLSPESRRTTAERLIDQTLVRREMELSRYPQPAPEEIESQWQILRKGRDPAAAGLSDDEIRKELVWQLTFLRFVEVRFRPGVQVTDQEVKEYFERAIKPVLQASQPNAEINLDDYRQQIEQTLSARRADEELEVWLKEARKRTEIVFHDEVFR